MAPSKITVRARRAAARAARGFTVVELMIVVSVVAILASIAGPSFREIVAAQRVRSAASALGEALWLARSEALKRNAEVGFGFDNVGNGWAIQSGGVTLHTQDALPGVASGAASFAFNAYGRLSTRDGVPLEIGVPDTAAKRCVAVTSTGHASTRDGAC